METNSSEELATVGAGWVHDPMVPASADAGGAAAAGGGSVATGAGGAATGAGGSSASGADLLVGAPGGVAAAGGSPSALELQSSFDRFTAHWLRREAVEIVDTAGVAAARGGSSATGAGGSSSSGGGGEPIEEEAEEEEESSAAWINPDLLEVKCDDCVCALCFGLLVVPTSGCPEGHSFCRACYGKALREQKKCPACRRPTDEQKLVRIRPLEGVLSQLRLRCEHARGEGDVAAGASGENPALAASLTVKQLKAELRQRGLDSTGNKPVLVARLEEDRKKDGGCRWIGSVGELAAHLGGCEWPPVKCPNKGCIASPLRKDLLQHKATCNQRLVSCGHCKDGVAYRSLAEHEGSCSEGMIECPTEGCSEQHKRGSMDVHRETCQHEGLACPCPGCDARVLRKDMDAHVEATHLGSAAKLVQSLWSQNAALEGRVAVAESKEVALKTSCFNWRADGGWGVGDFISLTHDWGDGGADERLGVTGRCMLKRQNLTPEHSHFIGLKVEGVAKCGVHAKFAILDKHGKILRKLPTIGASIMPIHHDFTDGYFTGRVFTPTAEEKAQSVRADGSIRLRAVVCLFLDGAA